MKYPIGIQNFESLVKDGYAYVDKTGFVYKLVSEGRYYFLSRPRRFGKSLLLSTLEAYFEGKKELFEGLKISELETGWESYPILHLDLNAAEYKTQDSLYEVLDFQVSSWEKTFGINSLKAEIAVRFRNLISQLSESTGMRVVILIDEYDKPLLQTIDNPELQENYRQTLKAFYGNLKTCDEHVRFAFLTGVTRFSKVSIFSDLNNLDDISLIKSYSEICGITEEELHSNFDEGVGELAEANEMSVEECYAKLKVYYDGYHFSVDSKGMYNPYSVLKTLRNKQFGSYWFETGTPEFLVKRLQKINYPLEDFTTQTVTTKTLGSIDTEDNPLPLLFQSGYLTIKGYNKRFDSFTLGFPNQEVNEGFAQYLGQYYTPKRFNKSNFSLEKFVGDIESGDAEVFMQRLSAMFADGNYQIVGDQEIYFQNTLYVFFKLLGFYVEVERHTSDGRMDAVIQTADYVYIIEIKIDQSADVALKQIEDKHYAAPFAADNRKLFRIGINFNSSRRCIDDWKVI